MIMCNSRTYYDSFPEGYFDEFNSFYQLLNNNITDYIKWKEFKHLKIPTRNGLRIQVSKGRRKKVLKRDKICVVCKSNKNLTVDHIVPYSISFDNTLFNLVTMCRKCNEDKGDTLIDNIKELYLTNIKSSK